MSTNGIEVRLGAIWAEVLGVAEIGPDDNFFDLGGESISGMMCINRVRSAFDVVLPLSTLMTEQVTLRSFAGIIDEAQQSSRPAVSRPA